ncbi:hypothetical protein B0H14DRAFT_3501009 [Mycena olivaceomarginata]|nr:hypothetical protein B0H14DRAFT_3501009 [Mycena olivaceomarginata]
MHCTLPPPQSCAWSRNSIASVPPAACTCYPGLAVPVAARAHSRVSFCLPLFLPLLPTPLPPCTRSAAYLLLSCSLSAPGLHFSRLLFLPAPSHIPHRRMRSLLYAHRRTEMQRWRITRRAAADDEARVGADGDVDVHSLLADLNADVLTQIDASTACPAPDAPYTRGELRDIFQFFFRQLTNGFKASKSPYYTEYFHMLESLSTINSVVLVCNLLNVDELMIKIFRDFFQLV